MIILELQSARYLLKCLKEARAGKRPSGVCKYMEPVCEKNFDIDAATQCDAKSSSDFKDLNMIYKLMQGRALSVTEETERKLTGTGGHLVFHQVQMRVSSHSHTIWFLTSRHYHDAYVVAVSDFSHHVIIIMHAFEDFFPLVFCIKQT
jgi:hypothetical protein